MNLSYLLTCSTETETLSKLLTCLIGGVHEKDEVIVLADSETRNDATDAVLQKYPFPVHYHALDKNYGNHKNEGNKLCSRPWIVQLDGDECPTETLLVNLPDIVDANQHQIELLFFPRLNNYEGVHNQHAAQWGWRLSPSTTLINTRKITDEIEYLFLKNNGYILAEQNGEVTYRAVLVNWCDYQGRAYKNEPGRIRWDRPLHEKIEGHTGFATLPPDEEVALVHCKTMAKQQETNVRYNSWFSPELNRGHKIFS